MATSLASVTNDSDNDCRRVDLNAPAIEVAGAPTSDLLRRSLSPRQVQMIAIGGTIGTGLFLGTGKSLATGGPASMLIAYSVTGTIVFLTLLALGEMATFIPVAGSFCVFAGRFVDDAFGFALTWNYWLNDAISVATDLVALQVLLEYWTSHFPGWAISLIFWTLLFAANIITVAAYGEVGIPDKIVRYQPSAYTCIEDRLSIGLVL